MDEYASAISTHSKEFGDGFIVSLKAFKDNLSAGHDQYFKKYFMYPIFPVTAVFYGIVAAAMVLFFPAFVVVWAFSPSTIWQLLLLIPLWSFNICRRISPMENDHLFFERMRQLDPELADELETKCNSIPAQKWYDAIKDSLNGTQSFILWCVGLILLSLIPVVGPPLAYIGESYLIARSLGCDLLEVYTKEIEGMNYDEREIWFKQREWRIIGFAAPLTLVLSIPFVGPMLLIYAQAMSADFFLHLTALEPMHPPGEATSSEAAGEPAAVATEAPSTSTSISIPVEAIISETGSAPKSEPAMQPPAPAQQQEKLQQQPQQQARSTALIPIESSS